ncbi:MAG: ABC transporter ATP-binding protein [Zoogloeaceae bacterium]|jgi:ABC-2 type transport system ATP-binding protein|nr:ABC transporter ATP-binding protein [Zoogloeaceae bacterium]
MIQIDRLHYRYRAASPPALDGVSLDIGRGSVYGLLGPNGAGKTTLISLLAGLRPLQEGGITLDGEPLALWRAAHPTAIALVPQDYAFYSMLTVAENLDFFAGVQGFPRRQRREHCAAALAFACLEAVAGRLAGELSGGLRRRLNLAIGLTGAPDLLLLDEPTVGVDPQSRRFLLDAVKRFAAAGGTVLYTSHYMEEVEAVCDKVAIIDDGKVLLAGTLAGMKYGGAAALRLELARPLPEALAADWRGRFPEMETAKTTVAFPEFAADALAPIFSELAAFGVAVEQMEYGAPNLEQVFMQLTRHSLRD